MVMEQTSEMEIRIAVKKHKLPVGKPEILPGTLAL
jgi:hypothetical protein